jgi:hypothetical protein
VIVLARTVPPVRRGAAQRSLRLQVARAHSTIRAYVLPAK